MKKRMIKKEVKKIETKISALLAEKRWIQGKYISLMRDLGVTEDSDQWDEYFLTLVWNSTPDNLRYEGGYTFDNWVSEIEDELHDLDRESARLRVKLENKKIKKQGVLCISEFISELENPVNFKKEVVETYTPYYFCREKHTSVELDFSELGEVIKKEGKREFYRFKCPKCGKIHKRYTTKEIESIKEMKKRYSHFYGRYIYYLPILDTEKK